MARRRHAPKQIIRKLREGSARTHGLWLELRVGTPVFRRDQLLFLGGGGGLMLLPPSDGSLGFRSSDTSSSTLTSSSARPVPSRQ
jgi:hypothetical protein